MMPRLVHVVTRLTAAIILLGITGIACSTEPMIASTMKANSDT